MLDPISIASPRNPLVQSVRQLHQISECRKRREFLLEGTHGVAEALQSGWPLLAMFWTEAWYKKNRKMLEESTGVTKQFRVSSDVLARLATTESPDGVVAVASMPSPPAEFSPFQLGLALESLQDPGNMGTVIRSASAAGADVVFTSSDSVAPFHPKVLRASAGMWFRSPPQVADLSHLIDFCKGAGINVLATAVTGSSYWECDLTQPTLVLFGNEGAGLSKKLLDASDARIAIPMQPGVESLNVAMTCALVVYEAFRQRTARGVSHPPITLPRRSSSKSNRANPRGSRNSK